MVQKDIVLSVTIENRRTVHFITPENIEVTYELAGIGSRFVAAAIDHLIQIVSWLIVMLIASQVSKLVSIGGLTSAPLLIQALVFVASFLLVFAYFVFFELRMGGQTPGKRVARLRVVRDGGYPIDPYSSIIRNLVRIVDIAAPPPYGAGLLSIFISRDYKRLGDFAAGTIVIKERPAVEPPQPGPPTSIASQLIAHIPDAGVLTPDEYAAIRRFVERRNELPYQLQIDLAMRLALPLMTRLGITVAIADQSHYPDLIEAIDRKYTEDKQLSTWVER